MPRDPFVNDLSSGRMRLALRTLAANDNVPLEATAPPRQAEGGASTRWPILRRVGRRDFFAELEAIPAPSHELGVDAGKLRVVRP
jgi:hypothetical protein